MHTPKVAQYEYVEFTSVYLKTDMLKLKNMEFDEFLQKVAPKIGPKNAFDLARDTRYKAIEQILINKLGITQDDIDNMLKQELKKLAEEIIKIPPTPKN